MSVADFSLDALDAVIFDAGGTLVELDFAQIAELADARGHRVEIEKLRRAEVDARRAIDAAARRAGEPSETDADRVPSYFRRTLLGAGLSQAASRVVEVDLRAAHAAANLWCVAIPGALEVLQGLRARGVRTSVISNADGRVEATLTGLGMTSALEAVVDSRLEGVEKPDPAIFQRALERLGVRASRAAYIGDIYSIDVPGARAAGMLPVLVDPFDAFEYADCLRIRCLAELLR